MTFFYYMHLVNLKFYDNLYYVDLLFDIHYILVHHMYHNIILKDVDDDNIIFLFLYNLFHFECFVLEFDLKILEFPLLII